MNVRGLSYNPPILGINVKVLISDTHRFIQLNRHIQQQWSQGC
jgi:hypothetical protein